MRREKRILDEARAAAVDQVVDDVLERFEVVLDERLRDLPAGLRNRLLRPLVRTRLGVD